MLLKIANKAFLSLLRQCLPFVGKGREVEPGLGSLHLEVRAPDQLRASAHDTSAGIVAKMTIAGLQQPGVMVIDGAQLGRLATVIPDAGGELMLTTLSQAQARVVCGRLQLTMPIMPPEHFLPLPKPAAGIGWHSMSAAALDDVIAGVSWAVCRDGSRPIFEGIHLTPARSEAINGHMMAIMRPGLVPVDVVVPGALCTRLRAFVTARSGDLKLAVEGNRIWIGSSSWAIYGQLLAGAFPNTEGMAFDLETDSELSWMLLTRAEVMRVVRRIVSAATGCKEDVAVVCEWRDGDLHLVSNYAFEDLSAAMIVDEVVGHEEVHGDRSQLRDRGLRAEYMLSALDSLRADKVLMVWAPTARSAPIQFHDNEHGLVAMVMPRRL